MAFYAAGRLYEESGEEVPRDIRRHIDHAAELAQQHLSEDCYAETHCGGGVDCHRWPTSLPDIDPSTPNPMGWRYIIDSHCGFHWPRFWKLDCGQPKGLVACTG
jgi:hypothetical protein